MSPKARVYLRFMLIFVLIGGFGIAGTIYTLVHQRVANPFDDAYEINAEFAAADGLVSGLGQPVNVVGVKVGQVTGVRLSQGVARVTLQIQREKLPRIRANAKAVLDPITPLKDMQINLDPGAAPARVLRAGSTLGVSATSFPVPLSDLLSTLDVDTRTYLSSLIDSLDRSTRGRADDLRAMLTAIGPTAADVGRVSRALAARRAQLARLIRNVALVTRAASQDRELADVVAAGDRTLHAIAAQEGPLRKAIAELPPTLAVTRSTLTHLKPFARKLGPTLAAVRPGVRRLRPALNALGSFSDVSRRALATQIRPLVKDAQPLVRRLRPAVSNLTQATPSLSASFQVLKYITNELAYNAPGDDEGFLFWMSWFFHNWNSTTSEADANGGLARVAPLITCSGTAALPQLTAALGIEGICEK